MQGDIAEHVFILKQGVITELEGEEVSAVHRSSDVFGCESLSGVRISSRNSHGLQPEALLHKTSKISC